MTFNSQEELEELLHAVHSGCMYWQKQKQYAQGKIMMNAEGEEAHLSPEYCQEQYKRMERVYDCVKEEIL